MVTTPTLWGGQVTVSADPNAFGFSVTGLADGNFTIVWSDLLGDLHGRRLDPLGNFNSTDFLFNLSGNTTQNLRLPEVVQEEDGDIKVFFSLEAGSADEDISIGFPDFATTGGSSLKYPVVNTARDEFKLDTAASEFNNQPDTVVAYTQLRGTTTVRDLYFAHLTNAGLVIGSPQYVPINAGETVTSASVTGLPNGNTLVAYTVFKASTSESFARYRVYDDYTDITGAQNASSTPGNDSFPAAVALEHSSDGFVIVTQDPLGIRFLYSAFGNTFTKSVPGTLSAGGGAFPKAIAPKVAALKDQGFIVAWTDTSETEGDGSPALKIGLQRFDRDGNAVGANLFVNGPGDQSLSSIATLSDGRVVLVYDSETGDSTNTFNHSYQIVDPREALIQGTARADSIVGRDDGSTIDAFEGNDTLYGGAGADTLLGGAGADLMRGRGGDDTYAVDDAGDQVVERVGEGRDTVVATASYALAAGQEIETLQLAKSTGAKALNLTGNEFGQTLRGNGGANVLDGKGGLDTLIGGAGDDAYAVDDAGDRVIEDVSGGSDTVVSVVSYVLAAGQEIETLQLAKKTGTAALALTGNAFGQTLRGNGGANLLDGKGGADTLIGGAGDDVYAVDNGGDRVVEAAGQGRDTLVTTVSYALAAGQEVETMQFARATGAANLSMEGNAFGQTLFGNAGANKLNGGLGSDTLTGKAGADTFVFTTALGPDNVDHITDFAPEDTIRLARSVFDTLAPGALAASTFKDVSEPGAVIDRDDRLIYDSRDGKLYYDTNGSDTGGRTLFAILDNRAHLDHADFVVA